MSDFLIPSNQIFLYLDCAVAFNGLTEKQKLYTHYWAKASYYGSLITLIQKSPESPLIFALLRNVFHDESIEELKQKATQCSLTEDEFKAFLLYAASVFTNFGNYKGHGDTKFIPSLPQEKFHKLILASKAANSNPEKIARLLKNSIKKIFSLEEGEKQLGFPEIGVTTYFSKNITQKDNEIIKDFLTKQKIEPYNTRAFKTKDETGASCYEIRFASALSTGDSDDHNLLGSHAVNGHKFVFTRGDYSKLLEKVNKYLAKAKEYAANEREIKTLDHYIHSFKTGSIESHIKGSALWVKNVQPIIETYIGFIETYVDPAGQRGEFEGFVAVVNKPMCRKFEALVNSADEFLKLLPWPSSYENEKMNKPDFTSLDVVAFGCPSLPIGINLPNYNDVKANDGFKNVNLGNVILTTVRGTTPNHLSETDKALLVKHCVGTLEMCVGLHELLGHGSGKQMKQTQTGFNFSNVIDLETEQPITTWYKEGETYDLIFGPLSSPMEECRAESVALYLSTDRDVLKIFGYEGVEADEAAYISWLSMTHSGLISLKYYQPNSKSWLQAHCRARFAILRAILEAGNDFIQIKEITGEDGKPDVIFSLDKTKIMTVGKPALGKFLQKLQLYRSTANIKKAVPFFEKYSIVSDDGAHPLLKIREIVVARQRPRAYHIQPNTSIEGNSVLIKSYNSDVEGMIKSYMDRYPESEIDSVLEELWEKDHLYFA